MTHVERISAREARTASWPDWVPDLVAARLQGAGVLEPWAHQVEAAETAWSGRSVVMATGTASGKSLGYLLPVLSALVEGAEHPSGRGATALYLAPTKAVGHDQLRAVRSLTLTQVRAATYDGDTPAEEREWVRAHASLVVTNRAPRRSLRSAKDALLSRPWWVIRESMSTCAEYSDSTNRIVSSSVVLPLLPPPKKQKTTFSETSAVRA